MQSQETVDDTVFFIIKKAQYVIMVKKQMTGSAY